MKITKVTRSETCTAAREKSNSLQLDDGDDAHAEGEGGEWNSSSTIQKMVRGEESNGGCDGMQVQQANAVQRPPSRQFEHHAIPTATAAALSMLDDDDRGTLIIPSAVSNLLVQLRSNDAPPSLALRELQSPGFGTLFGGQHESRGADQRWMNLSAEVIATIRMMLVKAIGNCQTLRALDLGNSYKLPRFHLALRELEQLLEPLESSEAFVELILDGNEILETEDGSKTLARFLKNNFSLETLHIVDSALNPHVVDSLVAHGHPSLRNLRLYLNPIEDGVFDTVRSILQACPKLQAMPDVEWRCDDAEDAARWAQVLSEHDSFNAVEIAGPVEALAAFLRTVLDSSCQLCLQKSLNKLKMMSLDDGHRQMPARIVSLTVAANRNLEKVDLVGVSLGSGEWQQIFKTLRRNGVVRNLQLEDMREGFDSEAWKELGSLVEASSKLEVLKIHDSRSKLSDAAYRPCVEHLFRAMQTNRSVKKIKLILFGLEIDHEGVSALAKSLETNHVLEQLALEGCVIPNMEALFRSLRHNTKLQKLGLHSCRGLNDEAYRELLGALQINASIREIELSYTCWVTPGKKEGKWAIVCEAMQVSERRELWGPQAFQQMKEIL
ncbi:hypothetical protein Mapa_010449 [Marchantia paleacea]|nr:hypothetical protein Mapa_010449 [Marchantia paleacea]